MQTPSAAAWTASPIGRGDVEALVGPGLERLDDRAAQRPAELFALGRGGVLGERRAGETRDDGGGETAPREAGRAHPTGQCPNALTIESVIFLASPNSINVLSRKKSSFSTPA